MGNKIIILWCFFTLSMWTCECTQQLAVPHEFIVTHNSKNGHISPTFLSAVNVKSTSTIGDLDFYLVEGDEAKIRTNVLSETYMRMEPNLIVSAYTETPIITTTRQPTTPVFTTKVPTTPVSTTTTKVPTMPASTTTKMPTTPVSTTTKVPTTTSPSTKVPTTSTSSPESPSSTSQNSCVEQLVTDDVWGLARIAQRIQVNTTCPLCTYIYDATLDEEDVIAYVLDTGVYVEHAEFEGRATHAFTSSSHRLEGDSDLHGHGTHVAGTIAGKTFGVSKKVTLQGIKVLNRDGLGTLMDTIEGIEFMVSDYQQNNQRKRAVCNLSLGVVWSGELTSLEMALQEAINKGIHVVVAAGNDGTNACYFVPGRMPQAITVGASDVLDNEADFSYHGSCVDILAPGVSIRSSIPSTLTTNNTDSGTSMAAPHVAGAVAQFLALSDPPTYDMKAVLQEFATKDALDMKEVNVSTPNILLYVPCPLQMPLGWTPQTTSAPDNAATSISWSSTWTLMIVIILINDMV